MDLETTREKSGMFYDVKSKNDVSEIGQLLSILTILDR